MEEYVGWEEVVVSGERGRREVNYYLKRKDGSGSDLVVVGKEKSLRHMSYRLLMDLGPFSPAWVKLKSRREVVDWLKSVFPDSSIPFSPQTSGSSLDERDDYKLDVGTLKDTQLVKLGHYTTEFLWLGSPWMCRKRLKHYEAFFRNGVKVSVNDFVYVLAEEDKRLVAYLEDMYEDSKGNKMVLVRWFHKIDEVDIHLPRNFSDREIFFSLCLQDLSIECIDGLATVLSPEHFNKFLNEAKHTQLEPFVCHKQYDTDDLKSFDITQVKGYWKQEILKYMYPSLSSRSLWRSHLEGSDNNSCGSNPRKRLRITRDCKVDLQCASKDDSSIAACSNEQDPVESSAYGLNEVLACHNRQSSSAAALRKKEANSRKLTSSIAVGSEVEVLSQDSGMRGCWFRAVVIKRRKNKVRLRYCDIKDADNEVNFLEEWVLASKVAVPDELGLRINGRSTIRPSRVSHNGKVSWVMNVGAIVDAWWCDRWWEGIVIEKIAEDKIRIYFPGEKREAVFLQGELRHSQEWLGTMWRDLGERPETAAFIISKLSSTSGKKLIPNTEKGFNDEINCSRCNGEDSSGSSGMDCEEGKAYGSTMVPDLSRDDFLAQLRWRRSRKRRRSGGGSSCRNNAVHSDSKGCNSLKVDRENYKYISDSLFGSTIVSASPSLVMSR